ncbi:MAG TPA: cytochrome b/b6 domain-containing protein, partial [Candidatus Acidoferrales bacterium]
MTHATGKPIRFAPAGALFLFALHVAILLVAAPAAAQDPNAACNACHAVEGMTSEKGKSIFVDPRQARSVHGPLGCTTCHTTISDYPHPARIPKVQCSTCHAESPVDVAKSAHGILGTESCATCHGPAHLIQRAAQVIPQQCASCHADAVKAYQAGIHASVRLSGDLEGATCQSCHGDVHKILPSRDPASFTFKGKLADTCAACHANPEFLARHKIPFAKPVESFKLSVHGRALEAGNEAAPSCSDCHASHDIFPARDQRSRINHWNVPPTCGACHAEIQKTFDDSVHGTAVKRGVRGAPVCTDCHGEHNILAPSEPGSLVNPARVSSVTCGHCHGDERLAARYNLPTDKVPAFQDSFHGLALRAGSQTVANCASCHGVHNILPSTDARSTIHPHNVASTCGTCHPGAGTRFALGPVHVRPATASEHPVVRMIRVAYYILIPFTLGFMVLHHGLDFIAKLVRRTPRVASGEEVPRMNLHFRIAHWLTVASFPVLVITGFALKYPEAWWATPILQWESEIALRGTIHRIAGVVLLVSFFYHVVHLIVSKRDRVILRELTPVLKDARDLRQTFAFNLGLRDARPTFGVFSYHEKIEYWAFMWGTVVMAISGFLLWFNNFTLTYFPKWVSDAATAIHFYE